jgi:LuxR family maltose regulon positive regulatory protein
LCSYLEAAAEGMERSLNVRLAFAFSLLRALALDAIGAREEARTAVSALARRARPHGLVRTFLDRGPRMRELLEAVTHREGRRGYAGTLLRAFEKHRSAQHRNGTRGAAATTLTDREREVLALLSSRYSNREIAERLQIGSETVKSHLAAIYRKLGTQGRREAVRAAESNGLLPTAD